MAERYSIYRVISECPSHHYSKGDIVVTKERLPYTIQQDYIQCSSLYNYPASNGRLSQSLNIKEDVTHIITYEVSNKNISVIFKNS